MKIIVCVDERGGLAFAKKRQSADQKLRENIFKTCGPHQLWMDHYSYKQFSSMDDRQIALLQNYETAIPKQDFLFIERSPLAALVVKCDLLIVYNWNRHYPADLYLDIDLSQWHTIEKEEFEGSSHPKITKEVFIK